jgi:hypothetical protein
VLGVGLFFVLFAALFTGVAMTADAQLKRQKNAMLLASIQYRTFQPHEAVEERARLDSVARRLSAFTQLGDFIEVYPTGVLMVVPPRVQRALVDEERTTMAVLRHDDLYDQIERICLTTALSDGRWIMTRKNFARDRNDLILPSEIDFIDFDWEMPLAELLAAHAKRVEAVLEHAEEGYRSAGSSNVVMIRTMNDCLADHLKRAELIRAKREALASRS